MTKMPKVIISFGEEDLKKIIINILNSKLLCIKIRDKSGVELWKKPGM